MNKQTKVWLVLSLVLSLLAVGSIVRRGYESSRDESARHRCGRRALYRCKGHDYGSDQL